MSIKNITSANSSAVMVSAVGKTVFEGYSSDDMFSAENVRFTDTQIGVDGQMSAGYLPHIKPVTFTFAAGSSTIPSLLNLYMIAQVTKTPMPVEITVTIPAVSKKYVCTGVFCETQPMQTAKKMLEPMAFKFEFQDILPISI